MTRLAPGKSWPFASGRYIVSNTAYRATASGAFNVY
jgi:hypothetical protein